MKPLFIWAVLCHDIKKQETYAMSSFQELDDAVAECEWLQKRATKSEAYYITALRLFRPFENVLP